MKKRLSRRNARSSWRWGRGFRRRGLPFRVEPYSIAYSNHAEMMEGIFKQQVMNGECLYSITDPGPEFLREWLKRVPLIPAVP